MRNTFGDEERFMKRTVCIPENAKGIKNKIKISKLKRKYGKIITDCIKKNEKYILYGISDCVDPEEERDYLSKDVWEILIKIEEQGSLTNLSVKENVVFLVDFVMPIAYEKCELKDGFLYASAILSSELTWNDLDDNIRKEIYSFYYPEPYEEYVLSESSRMFLEKEKYPILKRIMMTPYNISENLRELLRYRGELPRRVYGEYLKYLYVLNTRDVPTDLLKKLLENVKPEDVMSSDELEAFKLLPDVLTIYRGTDRYEKNLRLSWSLDKSIASKFASGQLIEAKIPKNEAIAFFDVGEKEVWAWVKDEEIITRHA